MRPGLIRPGNGLAHKRHAEPVVASMRPGLIRPGNRVIRRPVPRIEDASMRPGLIRPGNTGGTRVLSFGCAKLQ